jgi:spermidine synthase
VLQLLVFIAGMTSLAAEMSASRLLEPYFGTSLFVWANIIGLILIYLSVGYYLGGRIADRYPKSIYLYTMTAVAACSLLLVPFIARPILRFSLAAFATYSVGIFYGSLAGVILLFAIPITLLGCVSPFAIRLAVDKVEHAGNIAGSLYALSTVGSILGTFVSVFVCIPSLGTARTIMLFSIILLAISALGIGRRILWAGVGLAMVLAVVPPGPIKASPNMLYEHESPYNYIQVIHSGDEVELLLNEGVAIHSIYHPGILLTRAYWDYVLIAPYFNPRHDGEHIQRVAIVGLAAGTMAKELTSIYGAVPIDGVEIDPSIVDVGHQYFHMDEPNLNIFETDGRYFMRTRGSSYDLISVDAYHTPYIPFHLTTREFFQELNDHLTPDGVVAINVGRTDRDTRLVDVIARTMIDVYPSVYIISVPAPAGVQIRNSLVIGSKSAGTFAQARERLQRFQTPVLREIGTQALAHTVEQAQLPGLIFTDDHAPVEQLIDQMILDYLQST